jgi:ribosome modulation factor
MAETIYDEGRRAYRQGVDQRKCPYTDQARRETWLRGWEDARREFEAS